MKRCLNICFLISLVLANASDVFAIGTPSVSGSILRDTSVNYFDFTIKVTDIQQTGLTSKEKDLFKDRIRVWLIDLSSSTSEYVPFETDNPVVVVPFTLTQRSELTQTTNANSLTDFTYSVRITANNSGGLKKLLDDKGSGKDIKLMVKYYEDTTEKSSLASTTISVSSAVVQDAPSGVAAAGTHKALVVTWSVPTNITWTDNSQKSPTSVTTLVIDKSTTTTDIPAYIYNSSSVTDSAAADGTCVFDPDFVEGSSCINCSDANAYLNATKLESMEAAGYFSKTLDTPSVAKALIPGLTNDKPYAVVMYYGPGGLNRSSCVSATPIENHTWSEINGEDDATLSDPKCFIATAAYGSVLHKNLRPLRWFRDQVLLKTSLGRAFVRAYYEFGPRAAAVISAHPVLALSTRAMLWLPVLIFGAWMTMAGNDPNLIITVFSAFCAAGIAAIYVIRKTSKDA